MALRIRHQRFALDSVLFRALRPDGGDFMKPKIRLPMEELEAMWPRGRSVYWKPSESRSRIRYGENVRGTVIGYNSFKRLVTIKIISGRHIDVHPYVLEERK